MPTPTPTPMAGDDAIWFEGAVPAGATVSADADVWDWVSGSPSTMSGRPAHRSSINPGFHQHHFAGAFDTMTLAAGDKIFTYVYLDPNNMPNEVMLQWHERGQEVEGWEHRAYWGASNVNWGVEGTNSRRRMGALPAAGQWVRLEIPASLVGLEGKTVDGMAFTLYGGRASWDRTGRKTLASANPTPTPTPTPIPTPTPTPATSLSAPALVAAARSAAATLAGAPSVSAAEISVLDNNIVGAYAAFLRESNQFAASAQIDGGLRVSLYFARAAGALAAAGAASSGVQNRLQITASRLAQVNNLMLPPLSGAATGQNAHAPAAATNLPFIGTANTFSSASMSPIISSHSLGTITGDAVQSPLAGSGVVADTGGNKLLPFELAGASVSVGGRAASLLYVSPARIAFLVPQGLPQGEAEVIVTSQDGYVSRGTVMINAVAPALFTADASGAGNALVMNTSEPGAPSFEVASPHALGADKRTRVSLYATGIGAGAANLSAANDVRTATGGTIANVAESVTVEARTTDGRVYHLSVEFAGALEGRVPGLDQVNVVLHPELRGAGLVDLTIIINGQRSNTASINVR
jgi:uncharacterized protein (TIGR03437 family)